MPDLVVLRPEGLYCPRGDFHIDPWKPVPRAVITHGHGDHARRGMGEYHCSTGSLPILRARLSCRLERGRISLSAGAKSGFPLEIASLSARKSGASIALPTCPGK